MTKSSGYKDWKFSPEYLARSSMTLETALARVPVYHPWKSLDPGPEYPVDVRFRALPALTKKDMRENFPAGLVPSDRDIDGGIARGEIQLVDTSGTTDDRVTNIWNQEWWDASERASWKLNAVMARLTAGGHREAILVNPKNVGPRSDGADLPMAERRLERFLYLNEKTDPLSWSGALQDRMVRELDEFRPAVLEANPSYLARLSLHIARTGRRVFQPGAIVFTYEYPARFHYRQIRRAFPGVPTISSYGTTETGYVFMECEAGRLHQNTNFCRVDFEPFLPEHGGPHLGRILVTPLNNPWNYLVRFDTGDIVRLEESGRCACGRGSGLILSAIAGRKVNLTLAPSGRLVTLLELDGVLGGLEGVSRYKLVQTGPAAYVLRLVCPPSEACRLSREAAQRLRGLYGPTAAVDVVLEEDIAPEVSGKYLLAQAAFPIDLEPYLDRSDLLPGAPAGRAVS